MKQEGPFCWVVPVLPCNTKHSLKEAPEGCAECGILDFLCFETVEEANAAFIEQNQKQFVDGVHISQIIQ